MLVCIQVELKGGYKGTKQLIIPTPFPSSLTSALTGFMNFSGKRPGTLNKGTRSLGVEGSGLRKGALIIRRD